MQASQVTLVNFYRNIEPTHIYIKET
uniref:Uncharacterized protein n=1 Tax=mine drainage metagenome TaxID=410659 RepID=E6QNM2_9ZZZZ